MAYALAGEKMIFSINGINVIKALFITKDKNHIIASIPYESLVNHNCGVQLYNPFCGLETLFFLNAFDQKKGVYIFKE